jgi:hypothetical protein
MSANYADVAPRGSGAPRTVQVIDQLSILENLAQEGLKIQSELEQRLSTVLRSEPELAAASGMIKEEKVTLVPLADRIGSLSFTLRQLNQGYASIMRRLEV